LVNAFSVKDVYEVLRLGFHGALAWLLPEPVWWPLSRLFGRVAAAMNSAVTRRDTRRIAAVFGEPPPRNRARRIAVEMQCNRYEQRFQFTRAWRPGGWNPSIEISGAEHVIAAREKGLGILFWTSNFIFNDLVTKMALHQLGLAISHFSRPYHGYSTTRFGIRYLNAVKRNVEDRYLRERLMATKRRTRGALKEMSKRLREGEAVSFTVGFLGRRRARGKLLGTRITLATAPLFIAQKTGATILPVFTLRTAPSRFEVSIGPPIVMPRDLETGEPDYAAAIQAYADLLTPFLLKEPGQWKGWAATTTGMDPTSGARRNRVAKTALRQRLAALPQRIVARVRMIGGKMLGQREADICSPQ
jgi:lauroyl/myristoyl acyltransferase